MLDGSVNEEEEEEEAVVDAEGGPMEEVREGIGASLPLPLPFPANTFSLLGYASIRPRLLGVNTRVDSGDGRFVGREGGGSTAGPGSLVKSMVLVTSRSRALAALITGGFLLLKPAVE